MKATIVNKKEFDQTHKIDQLFFANTGAKLDKFFKRYDGLNFTIFIVSILTALFGLIIGISFLATGGLIGIPITMLTMIATFTSITSINIGIGNKPYQIIGSKLDIIQKKKRRKQLIRTSSDQIVCGLVTDNNKRYELEISYQVDDSNTATVSVCWVFCCIYYKTCIKIKKRDIIIT